MTTPVSGAISFTDLYNNFANQTNPIGYTYPATSELYNLNFYRGKEHRTGTFPAAPNAISFSNFYNTDGGGYVPPDPGGGG